MKRQSRTASPPDRSFSPSWKMWRGLLYAEVARSLAWTARLFAFRGLKTLLVIVGLLVQVVLLVLAWELVQVCTDIAEMWVALARKHLELTL